MFTATDYRTVLKEVFADRVRRNPAYSLRAFANQVGVAPSMLSGIFHGTKNLSTEKAYAIAQNLNFDAEGTDLFCLLVQLEGSKSIAQKETLLEKIHALQPQLKSRELSLDLFKSIADWAHVSALVVLELKNLPETTPSIVAKRLRIPVVEAELILERLCRLELVRKDDLGNYERVTDEHLLGDSLAPNAAIREFHRSMLGKAIESLETQLPTEKFIGSETLICDPTKLPEISAVIEECFTKVKALCARGDAQTEVYHVGVQFFRLTDPVAKPITAYPQTRPLKKRSLRLTKESL